MISPLLSQAFDDQPHLWLNYHLREPPCGCLFPSFCLTTQVLDWIENHGEAFLSKHTGVGKSLHRARALQKRHEDFEEVAQVAQFYFSSYHSVRVKLILDGDVLSCKT